MIINFIKARLQVVKEDFVKYEVCKDFQATEPNKVAKLIYDVFDLNGEMQENFIAIYLDVKNKINAIATLFKGTLDQTIVHPREVFNHALLTSSARVILIHNHPSGDVTPSVADVEITRKLAKAGEILGIEVLDHIIISSAADYYKFRSLKSEGYF